MKKKLGSTIKMRIPEALQQKLSQRKQERALRSLQTQDPNLIDFSTNDYLGFSTSEAIGELTAQKLSSYATKRSGSTGSRLLTGNYPMIEDFETYLASYYNAEAGTVFNSGYDANLGLLSSVAQRQDLILYDELSHASIRDGVALSKAKSYKFQHNNLEELEQKLIKFRSQFKTIYVVTEYVFSMDGDCTDVARLSSLCEDYDAFLILDEAHSIGTISQRGFFNNTSFARIITFGKAFGGHGAVILGQQELKHFLINFAKSFIYTTAPSTESTARNWAAHLYFESSEVEFEALRANIKCFQSQIKINQLSRFFIESDSAIQSCVIGGNEKVKTISNQLQQEGFDIRPILSPTVPKGKERLRFCLHSFNTEEEIRLVMLILAKLLILK